MKIESFVAKYMKLFEEETDPKIKKIYGSVVHDVNNVLSLIQAKKDLEALQSKLKLQGIKNV